MKLTEEEAKDKYCPLQSRRYCFGSKCMWWEWTTVESNNGDYKHKTSKGKCGGMNETKV